MLKYLHIENIAVIESSQIEFSDGFNVLTGETGAGKSIVIDSINAVLGERTSKDLIRAGCTEAEVSAVFGDLDDTVLDKLAENSVLPDEDGNILITRKLSSTGKGFIKINSKPLTATALKDIALLLIDIHGQHDNQALLNPDKHCSFLDAIADNEKEVAEYYTEFKNLNSIRRELNSIETDEYEKQRTVDLLKYQIDELTKADIKIGEIDELKAKLKIAENYETTVKALNKASGLIQGDEDNDGIISSLKLILKQLSNIEGKEFEEDITRVNNIISEVYDLNANVSSYLSNTEYSEINSNIINERLDLLRGLMLKYGSSEEEMLKFLNDATKKLEDIKLSDKRIVELTKMLDDSKLRLIDLGEKLTNIRKSAALKFEKDVTEILSELNMPSVKFKVFISDGRYTKQGKDVVEFLISANEGESLKPLVKIASGGELSRTMLAIKSALLGKDTVSTMIFDEIDTGISGYAADKVAIQLRKVSSNKQVICVTHLAQIAAKANNHLLIEKNTKNGRTYTQVLPLEYNDRINEIARIMSGTEITENLYNSAKELLDRSN